MDYELLARTRASEIRCRLSLGEGPINDIFAIIEGLGILLFKKPFNSNNLSGLFMKNSKNYIVVINSSKTLGHQVYSAAHELSHYFFDKEFNGSICSISKGENEREILANKFAEHFLMPDESVAQIVNRKIEEKGSIDEFDILYLQNYFGVSWYAILVKLKKLQYINDINRYLNIGVTKLTDLMGYDDRLIQKSNDIYVSKIYKEKALRCYRNCDISEEKLKEYLDAVDINIQDINLDWENEVNGGGEIE